MLVRGCKLSPQQLGLDLRPGASFTWSGFSSAAKTINVMDRFLGAEGDRTMWQLEMLEPLARDISPFSFCAPRRRAAAPAPVAHR